MPKGKVKKSIIYSGLIGTGGYFFAKLISLFYVIPLSSILDSATYTNFYGTAYNIYSYFLNIFSAGFPFAIATLVAKYSAKEDAKTILIIKRISILFLSLTGFVGMLVMCALSGPIAHLVATSSDPAIIQIMQIVLCILGVAIFFVPVLSAYRGFVQGEKEIEEYAFSQTFEQIFRVGFLLSASCLCVYALGMERKWALYASVSSTVIAAIAGLIQIIRFDRKSNKRLQKEAAIQKTHAIPTKKLFREFILLAIPYFVVAVLGYSDQIYNSILLPLGLKSGQYLPEEYDTIISAFNFSGGKIIAIPMILAPGFTAAIIPHITTALEEKNIRLVRSNVIDCLNIILYIGFMLSFCIFIYAKPITYILFSSKNLELSSSVLRWLALEGFTGTLMPVITNIMMALRLRKSVLKRLFIYTLIKGILMVPMIWLIGFPGAILSSMIAAIYLVYSNLKEMAETYGIHFKGLIHKFVIEFMICLCMWLVAFLLTKIGLDGVGGSRVFGFFKLGINGLFVVLFYIGMSLFFQIPQTIFHFKLKRKPSRTEVR